MKNVDLTLGSQVYCVAEPCGRISKIAILPETWEVKEIVIEVKARPQQARVLPLTLVAKGKKNSLYLAVHQEDLGNFPVYCEYEVNLDTPDWPPRQLLLSEFPAAELQVWPFIAEMELSSVPTRLQTREEKIADFLRTHPAHILIRQGVSPGLEVIGPGMEVRFGDEAIGRLQDIVIQPENATITHLVVIRNQEPSRQILVPIRRVNALSEGIIYLATSSN